MRYLLLTLLLFPFSAQAAWTATEDFESYADTTTLEGASGGSGWNGNWDLTGGTWTASADNPQAGSNSMKSVTTGADQRINRAVSAVTTGEVEYYIRSATANQSFYINLNDGSTGAGAGSKILGGFEGANVTFYDNNTQRAVISSWSTNTWYGIRIKFDGGANTYQIATTTGGSTIFGDYSPTYAYSFGGTGDVSGVQFYDGSPGTAYVDEIEPLAAAAATPASILGLVRSFWIF